MADVLHELFSEIADAIRTKSGGTDTMKPAAFPENILSIEGGGSGGNVAIAAGKVVGNEGTLVVEHGLGTIPDLVIFASVTSLNDPNLNFAYGVSTAFYNATDFKEKSAYMKKSYYQRGTSCIDVQTSGAYIHNATESHFSVGSSDVPTNSIWNYFWLAIAGLV